MTRDEARTEIFRVGRRLRMDVQGVKVDFRNWVWARDKHGRSVALRDATAGELDEYLWDLRQRYAAVLQDRAFQAAGGDRRCDRSDYVDGKR